MYKSIVLLTTAAIAVAQASSFSPILRRQTVELSCTESGLKDCGSGCIEIGYTCCPDLSAGCPATEYCTDVGCCPLGEVCVGGGGVFTEPGETITETVDLPEETAIATIPEVETSTSEFIITSTPNPTGTPSYETPSASQTFPTNATGPYPSASPSSVTEFPGAADETRIFTPFNLLAFILPFIFA